MKLLEEGDIIELKEGHDVYTDIPLHFLYSNHLGDFNETASTHVKIGEMIGGSSGMSSSYLAGRYVVVRTGLTGGGTGHGPHDIYPDGHKVTCRRIENENVSSLLVSFYQTGCFTAMIADITPIGRATQTWVVG